MRSFICVTALAAAASATLTWHTAPDGQVLNYALNVPSEVGDSNRPLHVYLHGKEDIGTSGFAQRRLTERRREL